MKKFFLAVFLLALFFAGTANGQTSNEPALPYSPSLDLSSMDKSIDPCVNFYQYACGAWQKRVKCRRYAMSAYDPDLAWFTLPQYPPSCLRNILARVLLCGSIGAVYDTPSP